MQRQVVALDGTTLGRYAVSREIARGGMAVVYLARDTRYNRAVALKVLRPQLAGALGAERFLREIELVSRLQHPNIVPLYDSGEADGLLYYVMPLVEGESLRARLDREPQLPVGLVVRLGCEVAHALSYAHAQNVVHRDLKPENILLWGSRAMVADFGVARAITRAGGDTLTQTGYIVGTPGYLSPEQLAAGELDGRSDVYSLGCVLYEALAGEPAFAGATTQALLARQREGAVRRLRSVRADVPPRLEQIIATSLAPVPAARYASAAALARELEALRSDAGGDDRPAAPATAPAVSPEDPTQLIEIPAQPRRGLRLWTVVLALGVAVLAGLVAIALLRLGTT